MYPRYIQAYAANALDDDHPDFGMRGKPTAWLENYLTNMQGGSVAFPTFFFPDKKPRTNIQIYATYPYALNGFLGYFQHSLDEINWVTILPQVTFTGGPASQMFSLGNKYPIQMLNFYCSNSTGMNSVFSMMVEGSHG